jgi:protein SCO1
VQSRLALGLFAATCALLAVVGVLVISNMDAQSEGPTAVHRPGSPFLGATLPPRVHAPQFALTDQNGKRVTMKQYLGKPVVVTYTYTHCKETCPLQAQMIRGALDDLGPKRQVPALAISVDPFGDTRASAKAFLAKQSVTGRIRYVLGTRRQLQPVWRGFAVQPQLRDSEHQALITLVDRNGLQRVAVSIDQTSPEDLAHDIRVLLRQ